MKPKIIKQKIYKEKVQQVASFMGGVPMLAQKLNITRQAIFRWTFNGIPANRAIAIEKLTNGKFKASQLIKM